MVCAIVAVAQVWPIGRQVRTDDRDRDGRPDIWRQYDRRGQLIEVAIDSNRDGRSDIAEYYDRSALLRRESDRNFNGQVDLVEEFDPATHEHVRSVVDIDFDGTADLLVLFHDGQPVFSKEAHPLTVNWTRQRGEVAGHDAHNGRDEGPDVLAPLTDPFRTDTSVRGWLVASNPDGCVGLSTSGGLPCPCVDIATPMAPAARLVALLDPPSAPTVRLPHSPRGPPLA